VNGLSEPVSFSVGTDLSSVGISLALTRGSAQPGGKTTLLIVASKNAAPGTYAAVISASTSSWWGKAEKSVEINISVGREKVKIIIAITPDRASVVQGREIEATISILTSKPVEKVSLKVTGKVPPNTKYFLNPEYGTPPFNSKLTLITSKNTPEGTYEIIVVASTKDSTSKAILTLKVKKLEELSPTPHKTKIEVEKIKGFTPFIGAAVAIIAVITAILKMRKPSVASLPPEKPKPEKRYCMHCGALMPVGSVVCPNCGKAPPSGVDVKTCEVCGAVIPKTAKFCSKCGSAQK
ncbi:MAG: hypothetical protein DRJ37_07175, partial [Thermoprotei archaeon]